MSKHEKEDSLLNLQEQFVIFILDLFKTLMKSAAACSLLTFPAEETFSRKHIAGWYAIHHLLTANAIREPYDFTGELDAFLGGEGLTQTCKDIHLKTFDAADTENLQEMIWAKYFDNVNEPVKGMLTYLKPHLLTIDNLPVIHSITVELQKKVDSLFELRKENVLADAKEKEKEDLSAAAATAAALAQLEALKIFPYRWTVPRTRY